MRKWRFVILAIVISLVLVAWYVFRPERVEVEFLSRTQQENGAIVNSVAIVTGPSQGIGRSTSINDCRYPQRSI